jgi:hypothetical protein
MRTWFFAFCLQVAVILPVTSNTSEIAKYSYPGGIVSVFFNPQSVARADLDSWMRLSPNLSPYNDLLVPIDTRRCLTDNKKYTQCENHDKLQISNVDQNIREIMNTQKSLDVQSVPDGLKPIVKYLSEIQAFALWRTQQQRAFLLTRNITDLSSQYKGLHPNVKCNAVLQQISHSTEETEITKLVTVDWANCVWSLEMKDIGPYPKATWQEFLTSREIKEEVHEETPDY